MGNGLQKRLKDLKINILGERYIELAYKEQLKMIDKEERRELKGITDALNNRNLEERREVYNSIIKRINYAIREDLRERQETLENIKSKYRTCFM